MRIAIIGAGIAGLACAGSLQAHGHGVVVFDKSKGVGGRVATRRVLLPDRYLAFDHGAQYFTVRNGAFTAAVSRWEAEGVVAPWPAAGRDAWVGVPGMNALAKVMTPSLAIVQSHQVSDLRRIDRSWSVNSDNTHLFDAVIVATPAEQAAALLATIAPDMASFAASCRSDPCWTAMVAFDERLAIAPDIMRDAGAIGWAARDSAKPGRSSREAWVIQATPDWSHDHLEEAAEDVAASLLAELAALATLAPPAPIVRIAHRWRYARARSVDRGCLWNAATGIGAIGDWLLAPRVDSAWLSGRALADRIGAAAR